jgi:hypothetical protein
MDITKVKVMESVCPPESTDGKTSVLGSNVFKYDINLSGLLFDSLKKLYCNLTCIVIS